MRARASERTREQGRYSTTLGTPQPEAQPEARTPALPHWEIRCTVLAVGALRNAGYRTATAVDAMRLKDQPLHRIHSKPASLPQPSDPAACHHVMWDAPASPTVSPSSRATSPTPRTRHTKPSSQPPHHPCKSALFPFRRGAYGAEGLAAGDLSVNDGRREYERACGGARDVRAAFFNEPLSPRVSLHVYYVTSLL